MPEAPQTAIAPVAKTTREILYATDFSDSSQRALVCAKHIAQLSGISVRTIHIIDLAEAEGSIATLQDRAYRELRRIRRSLRLAGVKEQATLITGVSAAKGVCDAARRYKARLLVIGLSADTFIISSAMGTTAKRILRRSPCPVMTVGIRTEDPPSHVFNRLLYVVDSDPASLEKARTSWPMKNRLEAPFFVVLPPGENPRHATADEAALCLQISNQNAAAMTLLAIRELNPDLIIFGLKTGGYLDSWNASSVAAQLIGNAPCPVLTVRTQPPAAPAE